MFRPIRTTYKEQDVQNDKKDRAKFSTAPHNDDFGTSGRLSISEKKHLETYYKNSMIPSTTLSTKAIVKLDQ